MNGKAASTPADNVRHRTPSAVMSSSLKERLKKCGRYHPATPTSSRRPSTAKTSIAGQISRRVLIPAENSNTPAATDAEETVKTNMQDSVSDKCLEISGNSDSLSFTQTVLVIRTSEMSACSENSELTPSRPQSKCRRSEQLSSNASLDTSTQTDCCDKDHKHEETKSSNPSLSIGEDTAETTVHTCTAAELSSSGSESQQVDCGQTQARTGLKSLNALEREKARLSEELVERKEILRKLHMVKTYRIKNDLHQLQGLIDKWRSASQEAVLDLHQLIPEPQPSLTALVKHLGIDTELLQYNADDECFGVT